MCILMCMRTNIELNDDLISEARKYSSARTKKALVEEALAAFIALKAEERRRLTYKERLERLRAKTGKLRIRSDTRDIIRKYRDAR